MTTPDPKEIAAGAGRVLTAIEWLLGSGSASAMCFGLVLVMLDTPLWLCLPLLIIYANYTTKIEQIHARLPAVRAELEKAR